MFVGVNPELQCFEGFGSGIGRRGQKLFLSQMRRHGLEKLMQTFDAWLVVDDSLNGIEEKLTNVIGQAE